MKKAALTVLLLCNSIIANAVEKIEVQALFSNKTVLLIDGKRHILTVNEASPEGVRVVSANSKGAVLEVNGQQKQYNLGSTVSTVYAKPSLYRETIYKNDGGMYMTVGNINGRTVKFLVDTGASAISMNTSQAKQLGVRYKREGKPASVSTASGYANAWREKLKSVSVGRITQNNVDAFVIDGKHPGPILLGMTFLGRLDVEHSGNAMTLIMK
jgi:aspartyl protease family protein